MAICALGFMQFDWLCRNKYKCHNQGLLVNIFIHIAIIYTHFYGFLYSAGTLFALIISDKYFSIFRPRVYISFIIAWLAFIPWLPIFIRQSQLGTWMTKPTVENLLNSFNDWTPNFFLPALLIIVCLIFIIKPINIYNFNKTKLENIEISLLLLAFSWLSVSVFAWLISINLQPIFLQRYLIPGQISWSVILACLFSYLIYPRFRLNQGNSEKVNLSKSLNANLQTLAVIIGILFLLIKPIYSANKLITQELPGSNDYKYGYKDLPIVVEFSGDFLERSYYYHNPQNNPYFFILDEEIFLDKKNWSYGSYQYKLMNALLRNYNNIFHKNIVYSQYFLNHYQRFLILYLGEKIGDSCQPTELNCHRRWFHMKIENNPKYRINSLGSIDQRTLILVETN
jgi:hypothetical protein